MSQICELGNKVKYLIRYVLKRKNKLNSLGQILWRCHKWKAKFVFLENRDQFLVIGNALIFKVFEDWAHGLQYGEGVGGSASQLQGLDQ